MFGCGKINKRFSFSFPEKIERYIMRHIVMTILLMCVTASCVPNRGEQDKAVPPAAPINMRTQLSSESGACETEVDKAEHIRAAIKHEEKLINQVIEKFILPDEHIIQTPNIPEFVLKKEAFTFESGGLLYSISIKTIGQWRQVSVPATFVFTREVNVGGKSRTMFYPAINVGQLPVNDEASVRLVQSVLDNEGAGLHVYGKREDHIRIPPLSGHEVSATPVSRSLTIEINASRGAKQHAITINGYQRGYVLTGKYVGVREIDLGE